MAFRKMFKIQPSTLTIIFILNYFFGCCTPQLYGKFEYIKFTQTIFSLKIHISLKTYFILLFLFRMRHNHQIIMILSLARVEFTYDGLRAFFVENS